LLKIQFTELISRTTAEHTPTQKATISEHINV